MHNHELICETHLHDHVLLSERQNTPYSIHALVSLHVPMRGDEVLLKQRNEPIWSKTGNTLSIACVKAAVFGGSSLETFRRA